jgi:hypothetical protein
MNCLVTSNILLRRNVYSSGDLAIQISNKNTNLFSAKAGKQ